MKQKIKQTNELKKITFEELNQIADEEDLTYLQVFKVVSSLVKRGY